MELNEGVIGMVSEVQASTMRVKVSIPDAEDLVTDWLHVLSFPGSYGLPDVNDQVLVFMDKTFDTGVVLGGVNNAPAFGDEDIIGLKLPGVEIKVSKSTGKTDIILSGDVSVEAPEYVLKGDLKLTGDFKITGDVDVTGKVDSTGIIKSMTDVQSVTVKLNTHLHPTAGTGPPSPPTPGT